MKSSLTKIFLVAMLVLLPVWVSAQWTAPTLTPPNGNVSAPLNLSNNAQEKIGGLILNTGGAVNGLTIPNGNVGIGTLFPGTKLEVSGGVGRFNSGSAFSAINTGFSSAHGYSTGNWGIRLGANNNAGIIQAAQNSTAYDILVNPYGGNVGVGVTGTPGAKLEVAGTIKITGGTPGAGKVLTSDATGLASWTTIGGGTIGGSGTTNYLSKFTGASTLGNSLIFDNGTNVGISNASPGYKLDVNGTANMTQLRLANGFTLNQGGSNYASLGSWLEVNSVGIYSSSVNGAHFYPNQSTSYGSWQVDGTRNGWYGLSFGSGEILMMNNNSFGFYHGSRGWDAYFSGGNFYGSYNSSSWSINPQTNATIAGNVGIGTASPGAKLHVSGGATNLSGYGVDNWFPYTNGANYLRGTTYFNGVLYDESNTGYYLDPASTSILNVLNTYGGGTHDGANYFRSNKGAGSYVGGQSNYTLQAYSGDGGAAGMSFHRGGYYAVNMGLDPDNVFRIGGWSAGANRLQLDMSGNLTLAGSVYAPAFYYSSDKDLKKNIEPLKDSLAKILKLDGVSFDWKETGKKSVGVIAQDVEKVYPELVSTDEKTGLKSVEYGNLVAPLIEAIKEQQRQIDELKAEVRELKSKNK